MASELRSGSRQAYPAARIAENAVAAVNAEIGMLVLCWGERVAHLEMVKLKAKS
jgi:hypothetical protein